MNEMTIGKQTLAVEADGLYRVTKEAVKVDGILQRKARLERTILNLEMEIRDRQEKVAKLKPELDFYNSPEVNAALEQEKNRRVEAETRAQELLRQYIGAGNFDILKEKKHINFTAKDGRRYKLTIHGDVYREINGEWKRLCIIRPKSLPLPDIVITVLANVKANPTRYPLRRGQ